MKDSFCSLWIQSKSDSRLLPSEESLAAPAFGGMLLKTRAADRGPSFVQRADCCSTPEFDTKRCKCLIHIDQTLLAPAKN